MTTLVEDVLAFYRRDLLATDNPARQLLREEGLLAEDFVTAVGLGYASGALAGTLSRAQQWELQKAGLIYRGREKLRSCLVIPVRAEDGTLIDLYGLWLRRDPPRPRFWQDPSRGLLGLDHLRAGTRVVLCEHPLHWLQLLKAGHLQSVSLRRKEELVPALGMLQERGTREILYLGRKLRRQAEEETARLGLRMTCLPVPKKGRQLGEEVFATLRQEEREEDLRLVGENEADLLFAAGEVTYRVDRSAGAGVSGRVLLRSARDGRHLLDRVDLASARSRQSYAGQAAPRLGLAAPRIEDDLAALADLLDRRARDSQPLGGDEEYEESLLREGRELLREPGVLELLGAALEEHLGFVGAEANRRLAVLVALSRLLPEPTGALLRGPAGAGKSTLLRAVARLTPPGQVMVFSRLTPQSLYFLPGEQLQHRLLVVDEYEGLVESEYALRTMMSSQLLSLAITVREGGRLPVTRTVNRPARLAVMASTTGSVNAENLSRFLELTLDNSGARNRQVLARMASASGSAREVRRLQAAQSLLRPVAVVVPYAGELAPPGEAVRLRRRFGQFLALVKAHAALCQHQRRCHDGLVVATAADYAAVRPLLDILAEHREEDLSPAAMRLLEVLHRRGVESFVRQEVMDWLGWSYSTAYRTLKELEGLELIRGDHHRNGVKRTYAVSAYCLPAGDLQNLPEQVAEA